MQTILTLIENKKQKLSTHSFCRWLEAAPLNQDALAFAPSMSYFVLGFRDILELVKYTNPQSDLEKAINHHCEEDSEHWKWFLQRRKFGRPSRSSSRFLFSLKFCSRTGIKRQI